MTFDEPKWNLFHDQVKFVVLSITNEQEGVLGVYSRIKSQKSIEEKLERKREYLSEYDICNITDIVGFRIIVDGVDNILPIYKALEHNLVVEEPCYFSSNMKTLDSLPEGIRLILYPGKFDRTHLVVSIGEERSRLKEWEGLGNFNLEVQIITKDEATLDEVKISLPSELQIVSDEEKKCGTNVSFVESLRDKVAEFDRLLDRPDIHEKRDIHPFLEKNRFLLKTSFIDFKSEEAIGLGTEYVMDFVIQEGDGEYILVEIESSKHRLFTKKGDFTAPVNHAQRQVEDWQQWIAENLSTMRNKYPNLMSPRGLVVIGRGKDLTEDDKKRLTRRNSSLQGNIKICTYDDLIATARTFIDSVEELQQREQSLSTTSS